jgi:hypothetical protein
MSGRRIGPFLADNRPLILPVAIVHKNEKMVHKNEMGSRSRLFSPRMVVSDVN